MKYELENSNTLLELLSAAKTDRHILNKLLHNYMPFIKKCMAHVLGRSSNIADNLTDAMLAFAHSVQTYQESYGPFISYAKVVIHNRLIDNARKNQLFQKRFQLAEDDLDLAYNEEHDHYNLQLEIDAINDEFTKWGLSWDTLLKKCPKQKRSRLLCLKIADYIINSPDILEKTLKNYQLPISQLSTIFKIKALEKYRQYIVAIIIITQGDYPYIYSFIPQYFFEEKL